MLNFGLSGTPVMDVVEDSGAKAEPTPTADEGGGCWLVPLVCPLLLFVAGCKDETAVFSIIALVTVVGVVALVALVLPA